MGKLRLKTAAEKTVASILVLFGIATLIGVVLLWPSGTSMAVDSTLKQSMGMNDNLVYGKVLEEGYMDCNSTLFGHPMDAQLHFPEGSLSTAARGNVKGQCPAVVVDIRSGKNASQFVVLNNRVVGNSIMVKKGDAIRMAQEDTDGKTRYVFEDMDKACPTCSLAGCNSALRRTRRRVEGPPRSYWRSCDIICRRAVDTPRYPIGATRHHYRSSGVGFSTFPCHVLRSRVQLENCVSAP